MNITQVISLGVIMQTKECIGERLENAVDTVMNDIEKDISAAKGMGSITEDKYDEIVSQIDAIRDTNNRLKCMIESIPKSEVHPEEIVEEVMK